MGEQAYSGGHTKLKVFIAMTLSWQRRPTRLLLNLPSRSKPLSVFPLSPPSAAFWQSRKATRYSRAPGAITFSLHILPCSRRKPSLHLFASCVEIIDVFRQPSAR